MFYCIKSFTFQRTSRCTLIIISKLNLLFIGGILVELDLLKNEIIVPLYIKCEMCLLHRSPSTSIKRLLCRMRNPSEWVK